jgi:DNA polymerase-3 subunit delta'
MEKKRVAHAYLFYGPGGTGKRTLAEIFASAINCEASDDDACGSCLSCRKAARGTHPDIVTVKPQGTFIRIAEIRALQDKMSFRPLEGKQRVFILDEAEKMNPAAANALLKTLEEPSPLNILILITTRPRHLPVTILSRCQRLRFGPLPISVVSQYLHDNIGLDPLTARLLAASSGGSPGLAMEMNRKTYLVTRDEALANLFSLYQKGLIGLLTMDFGKDREDASQRLDILKICFRDALTLKETGSDGLVVYRDRMDIIEIIAGASSVSTLLKSIQAVEAASRALERNANKQLTLEAMMFKLAPK